MLKCGRSLKYCDDLKPTKKICSKWKKIVFVIFWKGNKIKKDKIINNECSKGDVYVQWIA